MSHEQESTAAVPGITIQDFADAWGGQEAPGDYLLAIGKTKRLLEEIHHAVLKGEVKIFDPFLGRERLFRESESDMHALARGYTRVLPRSINDWLRSIGMATMPAAEQPARADAEPVLEEVQREPAAGDASAEASDNWKERARAIADELFDHDTKQETRDSLDNYAKRVMEKMQERGIHGPRGRFDNHNTIKREALQGSRWWGKKPK